MCESSQLSLIVRPQPFGSFWASTRASLTCNQSRDCTSPQKTPCGSRIVAMVVAGLFHNHGEVSISLDIRKIVGASGEQVSQLCREGTQIKCRKNPTNNTHEHLQASQLLTSCHASISTVFNVSESSGETFKLSCAASAPSTAHSDRATPW